jgi:hypothetical protein
MTILLNPAPPWTPPRSDHVVLWHGCTNADYQSILKPSGIDLTKCRADADFGCGFYTTTLKRQARQWAWTRFYSLPHKQQGGNFPLILEFHVDRDDLGKLVSLSFVIGDYTYLDYWSFVQYCRQTPLNQTGNHLRSGVDQRYDLVSGPVAADWRQRVCLDDADQFSFHTDAAVDLLQTLIKNRKQPKSRGRFHAEAVM